MYLMYVDESGDTGIMNSPTKHFALSSLVVHELRWEAALQQLTEFRRRMRDRFGLLMAPDGILKYAVTMSPGSGLVRYGSTNTRSPSIKVGCIDLPKTRTTPQWG